ncbi:MAG: hypothetical protein RLY86_503 [Pseudomonadota bacterium]|jgi:response regulator NasT
MGFRILIADDEAIIRRDLKELLEEMGYTVVAAVRSGRDALAQVAVHKPDVVILDIVMDGMDGLAAARELAGEYPVIMLTAHSTPDFVRAARDAGAMAYLTKPFRDSDIAPAVELAVTHFLRHAHLSVRVRTLADQLEARKLVDRAKSLLMEKDGLSEVKAYRQLQTHSMQKNIPMRQVAEAVIAAYADADRAAG